MRIKELCYLFTDGDWIETKDQSDEGIRLIQTGNIGEGVFLEKINKERYITEGTFKRLNCTEVFPEDILISRLPEPVGRGCIIPNKTERMITAVDCTICRLKNNLIDNQYFCYYINSPSYYKQLNQNVTGTTRKRISRKNLGNVEIKLPDKTRQLEIVSHLNIISSILNNKRKELQLLNDLTKARFVEMFGNPISNPKGWATPLIEDVVAKEKNALKAGPFGSALKKEYYVNSGYKIYGQEQVIREDPSFGDYYISEE